MVTAQKMKFSIKEFFSQCDQIRKQLQIWSHFLKTSLMENFIFLCSGGFFKTPLDGYYQLSKLLGSEPYSIMFVYGSKEVR